MVASITRFQIVRRMVWLCFYSIAMVVGGNAMFLLPQVREGLWAFDDGLGGETQRAWLFVVAFLYWAATAWFVARLMLGRKFPIDTIGTPQNDPFTDVVARWLPRLLGCFACMPMAWLTLRMGEPWWLAPVLIVISILFLGFVWKRREWFGAAGDSSPSHDGKRRSYRYFSSIGRGGWITLAVAAAIPHVILVLIVLDPVKTSRALGAPSLILVAVSAWTLVGSMLLAYAPKSLGRRTWNWVPLLLLVAFQGVNDNHPVNWTALTSKETATPGPTDERTSLIEHFQTWMQGHPDGEPVYFIAVAGGASRASYWAGVTLGRLEDEARASNKRFGRNVFAISSISGGSVGAAAFVAGLHTWPDGTKDGCFRLVMDNMLGRDVLSPVGALMLFPDLIQRFLPAIKSSLWIDRSRGLEEAWVNDWAEVVPESSGRCGTPPTTANPWRQPLSALHAPAGLPSLVLNTVRLDDGRRTLQSNLQFSFVGADDMLGPGFEPRVRNIALAGAAHNSARFPLVSPPGSVRLADRDSTLWGHLGDGGYHEVTGAATLVDMIETLLDKGCLVKASEQGRLYARRACAGHGNDGKEFPVVVIVIDNVPTGYPTGWQRREDGSPLPSGLDEGALPTAAKPLPLVEVTGPPIGLLMVMPQLGHMSEQKLSALAGRSKYAFIELRLPKYLGERAPSMNWQLDCESRRMMMQASDPPGVRARPVLFSDDLDNACSRRATKVASDNGPPKNLADEALRAHLQRLRSVIADATGLARDAAPSHD